MLENKEIAYAIGAFIEKYSSYSNCVTWEQSDNCPFEVEYASEIKVEEKTLNYSNNDPELWEFSASATIRFKEKEGTAIPFDAQRKIKGRAIVKEIKNVINQILPDVKQVLITNYKY